MDCSPPGSSVHGIFQAIILEWVAISYSRASFQPRDWTCFSLFPALAGKLFTTASPGKMPFRQQTQHSYNSPKPAPGSLSTAYVISVWSREAAESECMSWCHTQPFKYVMVAVQVSTPRPQLLPPGSSSAFRPAPGLTPPLWSLASKQTPCVYTPLEGPEANRIFQTWCDWCRRERNCS